jgi:hypothetical protein
VDLSSPQRDWLKPRVASLLAWHRVNELPAYQTMLRDLGTRVVADKPASIEEVRRFYAASGAAVERLTEKAMPDIVGFMSQLQSAQIDNMQKKFASDNAKLKKQAEGDDAARKLRRQERYVERFESWFGALSDAQVALIKTQIDPLPFSESLRLADRQRWQAELLALLRSKPDAATLERELRVMMLAPNERRSAAYRSAWDAQQQRIIALTVDLLAIATPKQKQALQKKLLGYEKDISGLLRT